MTNILGVRGTGGPGGPARGTGKDVSQREDLANFITMITRDETPFTSSIGKAKATAIYHEWQTDQLEASQAFSAWRRYRLIATRRNSSRRYRCNNPCNWRTSLLYQVHNPYTFLWVTILKFNGKTIAVSGTRRAVDQAGVADEYAYQLKKAWH